MTLAQQTIAIVGLGLIGGSLARDLTARGARVLGHDRDPETVRHAMASGHLDAALGDDLAGIEDASWVILAVPVDAAAGLLDLVGSRARDAALITDVGSTKRHIVERAHRLGLAQFVGSHPLAGDHRCGWGASRGGLFEGATVFVCPEERTDGAALTHARTLWEELGATVTCCSAREHDDRMAWVSHLPHVASFALALAVGGQGNRVADLGPGGRDAMRLAASSPALWRAIGLSNAEELSRAVTILEGELQQLRDALERGDGDALERRLARAAGWMAAG